MIFLKILFFIGFCESKYNEFESLEALTEKWRGFAMQYSNRFQLLEENGMMLIKIQAKANAKRRGIFIDCGKLGSDWLAISSCDYLIDNVLEHDQVVDYWVIPIMNPDGYEYTFSSDRLWQKNRREINELCTGVYLDRNYYHDFANNGENPCSSTYPGPRHTVEKETEYHTFKIIEFQQEYQKRASLSVQGWGSTINVPYTAPELLAAAERLAQSVGFKARVNSEQSGSGSATINQKIDLTFEFNPRGDGLIVAVDQIVPAGEELVAVVRSLEAEIVGCKAGDLIVGNGKGDITGSVTMVNLMGFAAPGQDATGLHGRLYSRTMYVRECLSDDPLVFMTLDNGMGSWALKRKVLEELHANGINLKPEQIIMSGTHTHSGPAGFFDYFVFQFTSKGYIDDVLQSMALGAVDSVKAARLDAIDCKSNCAKTLSVNHGKLFEANLNRSPSSYDKNKPEDIEFYKEDGNTDKNFTLLTVSDDEGTIEAAYNWFAVHPVAMNKSQTLINGDVKGWASQIVEDQFDQKVIVGFSSTNLGDVSPNINGHKCSYGGNPPRGAQEGQDCDYEHSTCPKNAAGVMSPHYCYTFGVGWGADNINHVPNERREHDMKESTDMIVKRQVSMFNELLGEAKTDLSSSVRYRHKFVDMTKWTGVDADGVQIRTCKPALGVAFGAGCTDGHGAEFFIQGTNNDYVDENLDGQDWLWFKIRDVLMTILSDNPPDREEYECHGQKPVLLPTGWANKPYKWHPDTIELGVYQIGELFLLAVPGEFTTMAGRYLREAVRQKIREFVDYDPFVVITGLSNIYTHYITTELEYDAQRYEAGSVIYGRNTLKAYTSEIINLLDDLFNDRPVESPGTPNDDLSSQMVECLQLPGDDLPFDDKPIGSVLEQPVEELVIDLPIDHNQYEIKAVFVGGNPRNIIRYNELGGKETDHFVVERLYDQGEWESAYLDSAWETEFSWEHENWNYRFDGTHLSKEHKLVGPLALFNYYAGVLGNGTQLDLLGIAHDDANNQLKDINFENYGKQVERQGNCGDQDVEDLRMHGYNLITTKLIINWQRELPSAGTYRFKYNAFVRDGENVELKVMTSINFKIVYAQN